MVSHDLRFPSLRSVSVCWESRLAVLGSLLWLPAGELGNRALLQEAPPQSSTLPSPYALSLLGPAAPFLSPGLSFCVSPLPHPRPLYLLHHGLPLPHACYVTVNFSLCREPVPFRPLF